MRTYVFGLITLFLLFVGNMAGSVFDLYGTVWQYDIPMHILGGLGIGLSIAAALQLHGAAIFRKRRLIIYGVLIAGILWELFEAYYNIAGAPVGTKAYYLDTVKDLIDDILGGTIAAYLCFPRISGVQESD